MDLKTFYDNFELLADAPNGVTKLREMILQLAVRGKLVPQDPNDEPASVLLEKIKVEKERLIKEGKLKEGKELPLIKAEEIPFEVPNGWEWARLRSITHDLGQKKPDVTFIYIDVTSINKEKGFIEIENNVLKPSEAPSRARKIVQKDTVIYSTVRPYLLNIAIIDKDYSPEPIVSTAFAVLHPFNGIYNRFLYYYLRSEVFIEYVEKVMTGMAYPAINDSKMSIGVIPLPPAVEQKRIVAKVDELMALCDELEAQKKKTSKLCFQLNESSLDKLTNGADTQQQKIHWKRINDNFDLIYSKPENVSKLRQTILQLAVMGKLVPQDPNDEPASVLLEKIKAEKERLIKEGKIRIGKELPPIKPDEIPFEVPNGWEWVRFNDLGDWGAGATPNRSDLTYYKGSIPWFKSGELNDGFISTSEEKITEKALKECSLRLNKPGDVLIAMYGATIGKVAILKNEATTNQAVCACTCFDGIYNRYLILILKAFKQSFIEQGAGGAQPNISKQKIVFSVMPLVSTRRQYEIVAKVDELMALCDDLEARKKEANKLLINLMESVVAEITST